MLCIAFSMLCIAFSVLCIAFYKLPSMHCRQCALAGIACFTACARLNHLLIPSNLLQQPCTVLQLNMLHRQALQQLHCPLHCAAVATCCSATATARHCCCASLFAWAPFFSAPHHPPPLYPIGSFDTDRNVYGLNSYYSDSFFYIIKSYFTLSISEVRVYNWERGTASMDNIL